MHKKIVRMIYFSSDQTPRDNDDLSSFSWHDFSLFQVSADNDQQFVSQDKRKISNLRPIQEQNPNPTEISDIQIFEDEEGESLQHGLPLLLAAGEKGKTRHLSFKCTQQKNVKKYSATLFGIFPLYLPKTMFETNDVLPIRPNSPAPNRLTVR